VTEDDLMTAALEALPGPEGERIVATLAERWMEEGKRKGLEEGERKGALAAAREAVLDALGARFGPVPAAVRERIEQTAELDLLRAWHRSAVVAESLEEFQAVVGP
jgi:predicted transposase YdaD